MNQRLRAVLLDHSDSVACRRVWDAGEDADVADLLEAMRITGGVVAAVADDGAAEMYARWAQGYERVTLWPPWTLGSIERVGRDELAARLREADRPRPVHHATTPFAGEPERPGSER